MSIDIVENKDNTEHIITSFLVEDKVFIVTDQTGAIAVIDKSMDEAREAISAIYKDMPDDSNIVRLHSIVKIATLMDDGVIDPNSDAEVYKLGDAHGLLCNGSNASGWHMEGVSPFAATDENI